MTLESIPLLRHLKPAELLALKVIVQERRFSQGQEIFREGAPGDGIYFVKSGAVEISTDTVGRRVFSRLGPGEIFGEMAIIESRPRSATVSAVGETEVFFLPRSELLSFLEQSPGLSFALLQHISARLRDFNQRHLREIVEAERLAAIGNFARGIIHDLKNPLSIIGLTAEMLPRATANPGAQTEAQKRIIRQVYRINELVSDILSFTEGRSKLDLQPGDFQTFIRDLRQELLSDIAAIGKPVELLLENEPPPVAVRFDRRRLTRVFHNLVHNAIQAMENGGAIVIRFKMSNDELMIDIEDSGPGIPSDVAGTLFEPFATHGKSHGTGLGLSICKKIVEDHGGKISARNASEKGAIFSFTLPLPK